MRKGFPAVPEGLRRCLLVAQLAWALSVPGGAVPGPAVSSEEVGALILQLGAEKFAVRDKADQKLLALGKDVLPALQEAARESDSPEIRVRCRTLVKEIRLRFLRSRFEQMGKQADDELDVEKAMWVIALFLDPGLERQEFTRQLDEMAAAVRKKVGVNVKPAALPPEKAVAALIAVLRDEYGLSGDRVSYQHPDNSSAHRVIVRRKGLPILLSEIAVAVAHRLELPVVGLGIPGRYMIKYDGARAPAGAVPKDIIINPFEGWREMTVLELARNAAGFVPDEHLVRYPPRETILRMMRNMENHAMVRGQLDLAASIRDCYALVAPEGLRFR